MPVSELPHDELTRIYGPWLPRTPSDAALLFDSRISRPVADLVWSVDGVPYLRPEVQLLHKAAGLRPKDQADFAATWPLLDAADRRWLRGALELAHPADPWLDVL